MKLSKLSLAIATALGASMSFQALAIELYVDTKTKQIYAEPGRGRVPMGNFERAEDAAQRPATSTDAAEIAAMREDLDNKTNELKAIDEHIQSIEEVKVKMDSKGMQVETKDKNFNFRLGGRIHADASYSNGDNFNTKKADATTKLPTHVEANDGTEIRRARMEFLGTFYKDWEFKSQVDFADNVVAIKDMYVQYNGVKNLAVTFGQQKQAFSRELQESSNDMMFMERSVMDVLNSPTVDRALGLNVMGFGENWTAQVGGYGDTVTANTQNNLADEGWGVSSRLTFAPLNEKTRLVHLGVAGNYRNPNANDQVNDKTLKYSYETSHMSNLHPIDSGSITGVNDIKMLGLEGNILYGPFTVGGEYTRTWLDRTNGGSDLMFDGWYGETSWTLTGESRKYKKGKFYKVEPAKPFSLSKGGWGAWELAARYAEINLDDGAFHGGKMNNLTVALNWYINNNIRFMADYNRAFNVDHSPLVGVGGNELTDLNTFMVRGQLAF